MPVVLAELLAVLGPWIMRFMAAKGVIMFAGFLGRLGLVIGTDKLVVKPLLDAATNMWGAIPPQFSCWFGAFGVSEATSIMISSLTLIMGKRIFFGKSE